MISEKDLRKEIEITNKEYDAYVKLISGFTTLQKLFGGNLYQVEVAKYEDKKYTCEHYLSKLTDVFREHFVPSEKIEIEE